jgi:hypothetical protein
MVELDIPCTVAAERALVNRALQLAPPSPTRDAHGKLGA